MHTVQLAVEDFATLNAGAYPGGFAAPTIESGETVIELLPGDVLPKNPFGGVTEVTWTALGPGAVPFSATESDMPAGRIEYANDGIAGANGAAQAYAIFGGNATNGDGKNLALILSNY